MHVIITRLLCKTFSNSFFIMIFTNSGVVHTFRRYVLAASFVLAFAFNVQAQISGLVFRDYNGNGTRQNTTGTFVEPLVPGVIVTAYGANDVILASYTTTGTGTVSNYSIPETGTYNGIKGSNTGSVANNVAVRLEFLIPANSACLVNSVYDFSSKAGKTYGTSVRFLATSSEARSGYNFALNNPHDYVAGATPKTSTFLFQTVQFNGNPIASPSGTSANERTLVKFPYNSNGSTAATTMTTAAQTGSVYGVAYSKFAKKIFTSAYMKRHSGFGPIPSGGTFKDTPGAIYMVDAVTNAVSFFLSLDGMPTPYPTHNWTKTPSYGVGKSYTLSGTGTRNTTGRTETVSFSSQAAMGVIGTNVMRGLGGNKATASNDPAAFGQAGKVSLGAIEISSDGRYLFVVNLYDRKIYQFQFNSITNPTSATFANSWELPNPPARSNSGLSGAAVTYASSATINHFYNGTRGLQRPFALKYRNGKLYIGSVTTGEGTGAVSITDNNSGDVEYTDLWAYVWELTPSVNGAASVSDFSSSPVLQFPLNYPKGINGDTFDEAWRPWTNTIQQGTIYEPSSSWGIPQAILAGIEFDVDGSMILGLRDRTGDQGGYANRMLDSTGAQTSRTAVSYGDQLRAYKNPSSCTYELESNGKEGVSSSKSATGGANGGPLVTFSNGNRRVNLGPGGGEFYYQDGVEMYNGTQQSGRYHLNTAMGGLALMPGTEEVTASYMDPLALWSGGISWMNNNDGTNTRDYQLYAGSTVGEIGKANGLGDIELLFENAPLEIGNRIWQDTNGDGIQGADEPGIGGVLLELVNEAGTVIATVVTATDGTWYFTTDTGTDGTGVKYGVNLLPSTSYTVRLATSGEGNDWDPTANSGAGGPRTGGALAGLSLTAANKTGNGEADISDSDATLVDKIPSITFTTGGYGENNHTLDIGFAPYGSIGDYVWYDTNYNGAQDSGELPAAGVTVTLWKSTDGGTTWNESFATTTTNSLGYYHFGELLSATYKVVFTKPTGYEFTKQNEAPASDEADSDVNNLGQSQNVTIDVSLAENNIGRNNPTIDAGLVAYGSIGDKVWYDTNKNGKQDIDESPADGVTVNLWKWIGSEWKKDFATQETDINGKYLFDNLESGTYKVEFVAPLGSEFTYFQKSGVGSSEDSDAGENGLSDDIIIDAALAVENIGRNNPTIDAGLVPEGALPVSLTSFAAKASEEKAVNLTWTTTMETNSAYFEVQKSATGKSWSTLGTVDAKGESRVNQSYNYIDIAPLNGQNFYRLKMVDRSGEFAYSKLESVVLKGIISINVYPNPTIDKFQVAAANGIEVVELSIYSGVGRLVMEVKNSVEKEIDIRHLPQGAYVVKIVTKDGAVETRKLILRK